MKSTSFFIILFFINKISFSQVKIDNYFKKGEIIEIDYKFWQSSYKEDNYTPFFVINKLPVSKSASLMDRISDMDNFIVDKWYYNGKYENKKSLFLDTTRDVLLSEGFYDFTKSKNSFARKKVFTTKSFTNRKYNLLLCFNLENLLLNQSIKLDHKPANSYNILNYFMRKSNEMENYLQNYMVFLNQKIDNQFEYEEKKGYFKQKFNQLNSYESDSTFSVFLPIYDIPVYDFEKGVLSFNLDFGEIYSDFQYRAKYQYESGNSKWDMKNKFKIIYDPPYEYDFEKFSSKSDDVINKMYLHFDPNDISKYCKFSISADSAEKIILKTTDEKIKFIVKIDFVITKYSLENKVLMI